jgi:hypothetical protein
MASRWVKPTYRRRATPVFLGFKPRLAKRGLTARAAVRENDAASEVPTEVVLAGELAPTADHADVANKTWLVAHRAGDRHGWSAGRGRSCNVWCGILRGRGLSSVVVRGSATSDRREEKREEKRRRKEEGLSPATGHASTGLKLQRWARWRMRVVE